MNVEAYDVDLLRKMVRILEYENRLLKDELKKARLPYDEINPFEVRKLGKEFQIPIYKHQKLRNPQELEWKTM